MTHRTDAAAKGREIVARWCNLAEQRLDHLTELFESGRWRRYHTEHAFLENIREAKTAVETWRNLLAREASLDNSPIDLSWLGRGKPLPKYPMPERKPEPVILAEAAMTAVTAALETVAAVLEEPAVMIDAPALDAPAPDVAPMQVLDLAAMQARYPLLRSSL